MRIFTNSTLRSLIKVEERSYFHHDPLSPNDRILFCMMTRIRCKLFLALAAAVKTVEQRCTERFLQNSTKGRDMICYRRSEKSHLLWCRRVKLSSAVPVGAPVVTSLTPISAASQVFEVAPPLHVVALKNKNGEDTLKFQKNQESSTSLQSVLVGSMQHLNVEEEQILPASAATDINLTTSPQDVDIHDNELYSSLLSGSLFDVEEPGTHDPVAAGPDISLNADEEEFGQKASSENADALGKDLESLSVSPDGPKDNLSASIMSYHDVEAAEEPPHAPYQPVTGTPERGNQLATETSEGQQSDTDAL